MIKYTKKLVLALLVVVGLYWAYGVASRGVRGLLGPVEQPKAALTAAPTDFAPDDQVAFAPSAGSVTDLKSDKTLDAILSGAFGPAVVMVYADWCSHCRNMMDAYEAAAKGVSGVPFVRIQGREAPISSRKHAVTGYPTVFGVANVGGPPRRFMAQRTTDALVEFARGLAGLPAAASLTAVPAAAVPTVAAPVSVPPAAVPTVPAVPAVPAASNEAVVELAPTMVMVQ